MFSGLKLMLTLTVSVYLRIVFCLTVKGQLHIPKCCPVGEQFNESMICITSGSVTDDWGWVINNSIAFGDETTISTFNLTILANTSLSCQALSR
jgi:hypothetical protein